MFIVKILENTNTKKLKLLLIPSLIYILVYILLVNRRFLNK